MFSFYCSHLIGFIWLVSFDWFHLFGLFDWFQVAGGGDEDDVADEALFMQESLELHYNVAELIGKWVSDWLNDWLTDWLSEWDKFQQSSLCVIYPFVSCS